MQVLCMSSSREWNQQSDDILMHVFHGHLDNHSQQRIDLERNQSSCVDENLCIHSISSSFSEDPLNFMFASDLVLFHPWNELEMLVCLIVEDTRAYLELTCP